MTYSCVDVTQQDLAFFSAINNYRMGIPRLWPIPMGTQAYATARFKTSDNAEKEHSSNNNIYDCESDHVSMHSWRGTGGPWEACCYSTSNPWCMWSKIREISGDAVTGEGFEIALGYYPQSDSFEKCMNGTAGYSLKDRDSSSLLDGFLESDAHRAVIANEGQWQGYTWTRVGVSVGECIASVWFTRDWDDVVCDFAE